METITLKAEVRTLMGRDTIDLRLNNVIPVVVYGMGEEALSLQVSRSQFDRVYGQAGESTVVQLDLDGKQIPVLIHDMQIEPQTDFTIHADFLRVDMTKKVEAGIQIVFIGEAAAVETLGGTLVQNLDEVEVRALPGALVREIEVDISKLATFDDAIHVSDIVVPAGIEILTEMDTVVATVQEPLNEAELDALNAPVEADVNAVEVTTEKKVEEGATEEAK
jgi:large subunit ribosomal protein L25